MPSEEPEKVKLRARAAEIREELERERQLFIQENAELQRLTALQESAAEGNSYSKKHGKAWSGLCSQEWHLILLGLFCLGVVIFANTSGRPPPPSPEAGETFLSVNAKEADVHVRPSGLQYRVIREGYGYRPKRNSKVKVLYEGRLIDGTVRFGDEGVQQHSSWIRGQGLDRRGASDARRAKYEFFTEQTWVWEQGKGEVDLPECRLDFQNRAALN